MPKVGIAQKLAFVADLEPFCSRWRSRLRSFSYTEVPKSPKVPNSPLIHNTELLGSLSRAPLCPPTPTSDSESRPTPRPIATLWDAQASRIGLT